MTHALEASNLTSPAKWLVYASDATSGWFGIVVLLVVFVIVMTHLARNQTSKAFTASMLITLVVAMFLRLMKVVADFTFGVVVVVFVLAVLWDGFSD